MSVEAESLITLRTTGANGTKHASNSYYYDLFGLGKQMRSGGLASQDLGDGSGLPLRVLSQNLPLFSSIFQLPG